MRRMGWKPARAKWANLLEGRREDGGQGCRPLKQQHLKGWGAQRRWARLRRVPPDDFHRINMTEVLLLILILISLRLAIAAVDAVLLL